MSFPAADYQYDFRAVSFPLRLYSGEDALEQLPAEVRRAGAKRAFIVCGRTVSRRLGLIARIRAILGPACAGVFDEMDKDTTLDAVLRAAQAAKDAQADLLVSVGAGSVTLCSSGFTLYTDGIACRLGRCTTTWAESE